MKGRRMLLTTGLAVVAFVPTGAFGAQDAGTSGAERVERTRPDPAASAITLPAGWEQDAPALASLVAFDRARSDLESTVTRYGQDRAALLRRHDAEWSPARRDRLRRFHEGWLARVGELDVEALNPEGRIDHILLRHELEFEREMLEVEERLAEETAPLVPFAPAIRELQERRRDREDVNPREAAATLAELARQVEELTEALRGGEGRARARAREGAVEGPDFADVPPVTAFRAVGHIGALRRTLAGWYGFYGGYDPLFTWWARAPYERLERALERYVGAIREELLGIREGDKEPIIGDPIGEDGLRAHLAHEMIPYTAEELIAIAEREFAWLEEERLRASRDMGYGDDWRAALEAVKETAVPPGEKPAVVRELARQSEAFLDERGSVTIPPLAREVWRMEMLSPERQLLSPFFLGGEVIRISYPTDEMSHEDKLMSMRGNNPHFNRATVHHELIPGHHLQGFMTSRFNAHRSLFSTPFWGEGWALYWELVLWDQGFPRGPEDRMGMLFWRTHRAARIIFSLSFHVGRMTPEEAVDFLVERVGHERANAEAEVRRSFQGDYSPLYQAAYMVGGLQFRALREELVESGRMSERAFHDAILRGGRMPVEMVRARLLGLPLEADHRASWRFAGDPIGGPEGR